MNGLLYKIILWWYCIFYNNTGYGSSTSGRSVVGIDYINFSTNVDIRSNLMANFGTADIDTGWTISPTTNATSDSSGQTTGITASDHFVSIVGGSEDLHLVESSSLSEGLVKILEVAMVQT